MTDPNAPASPCQSDTHGKQHQGMTKREFIAATNVTWQEAQFDYTHTYRSNGTFSEIACHLATMKIAVADALISALNKEAPDESSK